MNPNYGKPDLAMFCCFNVFRIISACDRFIILFHRQRAALSLVIED